MEAGLYSQGFFHWACTQAARQYCGFTFPYCTTHFGAAVGSIICNIFQGCGLQSGTLGPSDFSLGPLDLGCLLDAAARFLRLTKGSGSTAEPDHRV